MHAISCSRAEYAHNTRRSAYREEVLHESAANQTASDTTSRDQLRPPTCVDDPHRPRYG